MQIRLDNKVALVTGGNTGIGRAVCLAFADAGADIAVGWYEQEGAAQSLAEEIAAKGRKAALFNVDVSQADSVADMMENLLQTFGRIDILVNNAGIQKAQPISEMNVADWDNMLAVHLRGAFLCSQAASKAMIAQGSGRIINLCSQLGYIGRANYAAYSTAKGGMIAFTRALAQELAPHGILVNGVAPGLVDTGFDPLSEQTKQDHAAKLPLQRLGTPEDMTSAFVFLASDAARYYCGQLLHPNGGEIMP